MKTKIVTVDKIILKEKEYKRRIKKAGKIIKKGGLVAFPTETVYGLGGDAFNKKSAAKIYAAKGRPSDNPLIVHIAELSGLEKIVQTIPPIAKILAKEFWPGPLTMIFNKKENIPTETTGGLQTIAVRFPSHIVARDFIMASGGYVAAPSANISGKPSPTLSKYVVEDMNGKIDMILDSDTIEIGLESTIVDVTTKVPIILRPGFITREMIEKVVGSIEIESIPLGDEVVNAPRAPGMKYRHYAPKGELTIIEGPIEKVVIRINQLTKEALEQSKKVGIIATEETKNQYKAEVIKSVGARNNEEEIAGNLFTILREFDDEGVVKIYSESFDTTGIGQAIMNRLLKAAGHRIESV